MRAFAALSGVAAALALSGCGAMAWSFLTRLAPAPLPAAAAHALPPADSLLSSDGDSLSALAVGRDVFRVTRRPASVAFNPDVDESEHEPERPPRPLLQLLGIVAGRDPTAIVDGLPGSEGPRVVRAGDVIGPLAVERITPGEVRIAGMDTVWVLQVREPWRP